MAWTIKFPIQRDFSQDSGGKHPEASLLLLATRRAPVAVAW